MEEAQRSWADRLYRRLLRAYPEPFRAEYGVEMERLFRDCRREAAREGQGALAAVWLGVVADLARTSLREQLASLDPTAAVTRPHGRDSPSSVEAPMAVAMVAIVVGVLLGIAGVQELYFRGIVNNEPQPFFIGFLGTVTSLLLVAAGVAMMRGWPQRRNLMLIAAILNAVFLVYSALPPHRNVGILALVIGAAVSCLLGAKALAAPPPGEAG
jgi:hypothetical protein